MNNKFFNRHCPVLIMIEKSQQGNSKKKKTWKTKGRIDWTLLQNWRAHYLYIFSNWDCWHSHQPTNLRPKWMVETSINQKWGWWKARRRERSKDNPTSQPPFIIISIFSFQISFLEVKKSIVVPCFGWSM